jgi:cytochrome b6-f complex iron-sulfur subunit
VNRRRFLARCEGAAAAAAAGALGLPLSGCLGFYYVNGTVAGDQVRVRRGEFGAGPFALVDVPRLSLPLYLYRHGEDRFSAVSTRCMHRGCQVEPVAGHLVCPCHGSEYANDGAVLKGPTRLPLHRFDARVDGEEIVIDLPPGIDP